MFLMADFVETVVVAGMTTALFLGGWQVPWLFRDGFHLPGGLVLGLPHLFTFGTLAFFDCGGVRLYLQEGKKEVGEPGDSVLYFRVADIQETCRVLSERGVKFLGAPHLIHRHDSGVEEWMAFFEDPDGKVLALMSQVKPVSQP